MTGSTNITQGAIDRRKLEFMHGSISANHRNASNTSAGPWKKPPTSIQIPSSSERPLPASKPPPKPNRGNENPFTVNNTLPASASKSRAGNPIARQTLLGRYSTNGPESRAWKRQKLDDGLSSEPAYRTNGASSSHAGRIARHSNASEPEIQEGNPPNSISNDAEIILLDEGSEDVGERVSRSVRTSSPDPLYMPPPSKPPPQFHPFETHPKTNLPMSRKGKGRAASPLVVQGSEEDEIEEFPAPSSKERPSGVKTSQVIPKNIVKDRRIAYERAPEPAAVRHSIQPAIPSLHLLDQIPQKRIVSKMRGKDEHPSRVQGGASPLDLVGTSSSNFTNSPREKEGSFSFQLEAWCFGFHQIRHSEDDPLRLNYERKSKQIRVISGKRTEVQFKLDRDVDLVQIVNDVDEPLKNNVVIQFTTVPGNGWKKYQSRLKGFIAGGQRHKGDLTFLFSTAKEREFNLTKYYEFATLIRKEFPSTAVSLIRPNAGRACWEEACKYAEMYEAEHPDERSEATEADRLSRTRGSTPSSTSIKSQISRLDSKPTNGDMVPPVPLRRSARQSAFQTVESSPPRLPPPPSEPDELVLMYPPTGTGALSIMRSDLKRLGPEEYLNDTLIEFGLKLWLNDLREKDPALADQIHVFSSFFYKKLNNRKNPEEGYRSVRKWTSKVGLFSKKYVIVPINENVHWYLAIIYEPGHTLEPPLPPSQPHNARLTRKRKQELEHPGADIETPLHAEPMEVSPEEPNPSKLETEADPSSISATCASTPHMAEDTEMANVPIAAFDKSCSISASKPVSAASSKGQTRDSSPLPDLLLPASDDMEIDVDSSIIELHSMHEKAEISEPSTSKSSSAIPVSRFYASASEKGENEPAYAPVVITDDSEDQQQEEEVDDMLAVPQSSNPNSPPQTYIFTLDSLGTRHPQAIKVLKNYLTQEAKDKHDLDEVREAIGKQVQVPVQPNTWDCGIYLLHFVKVFMSSPVEFLEQILSTRGTIPSSERKKRWQDHEIPLFRDDLIARISELSEKWKATREETKKQETEDLTSDGEVDIVGEVLSGKVAGRKRRAPRPSGEGDVDIEEVPSGKAASVAKEKRQATRLRG